jgi:hypothetical protein
VPPAGAYRVLPVAGRDEASVALGGGPVLSGASLAALLKASGQVILMAATVGREIVEQISREVEKGDAAMGLLLDSVASQTADAALDWMERLFAGLLAREGRRLARHRYSPGYGDLPLSCQKDIFEACGWTGSIWASPKNLCLYPRNRLSPSRAWRRRGLTGHGQVAV